MQYQSLVVGKVSRFFVRGSYLSRGALLLPSQAAADESSDPEVKFSGYLIKAIAPLSFEREADRSISIMNCLP